MNSNMRVLALCLFLFLAPCGSFAGGNGSVVGVRTFLASNAVHPGSEAKVAVVATVASGFHINDHQPSLDYLIPTEVVFEKSASLSAGDAVYPRGKSTRFDFLDSPISVYEGEIRVGAILRASRSLRPGTYKLRGNFAYQACNDHACLPPAKVPFEIAVRVVPFRVPVMPANSELFAKISFR
jgi:thioredoxin:protein disulfide reductase